MPSVGKTKSLQMQQIIRIQYNKNWETLLTYLLRTKVSCKAVEIAATRLLKAQSFFVCHATNSLTCIIAQLIN